MRTASSLDNPDLITTLLEGGIAILRTDTLYGLVARADDEQAVRRVYQLKDRDERKSPIVLIASVDQLYDTPPPAVAAMMRAEWPGKVSIIEPSTTAPVWLRRENDSVAYRLPDHEALRALLARTGPLIAPSANPEGHVPAMSIEEAYDYFGDRVDIYVDGGRVEDDTPSKLLRVHGDGTVERLR